MWPLPVSDLFMVGRKTAARLHSLNIHTIGQLANTDEAFLKSRFKEHGTLMHRYANGDDVSDITPIPQPPKSIGHGTTLPENITDTEKAHTAILALCEKVSARLRSLSLKCTYVDVYIRYADFSGVSQRSQNPPTDSTNAIFKNAKYIINSMWDNSPIRAITVTLGGLCNKNETQCSFIYEENQNEGCEIDNAVDRMRSKYGFECVTRASLLKNPLYKKIKNDNIPKMQSKL